MRQRAYELIKIAHPSQRESLEKAAFDRLKIMPSADWSDCLCVALFWSYKSLQLKMVEEYFFKKEQNYYISLSLFNFAEQGRSHILIF